MKRKFLSLLLSAVMLFTLITPAFAAGEQLPDGAAMEEQTVGGEVGEAVVDELAEDEEVIEDAAILFDGDVIPEHNNDESFVATVNNCEAFLDALDDPSVIEIVVNGEVEFNFPENNEENFEINKPVTVNGFLRFANTYVTATEDVTVNESGKLELAGDFTHYTELHLDAPDDYWDGLEELPTELNGPKLTNNGEIEMQDLSGIMLSWPCDYAGEGELSGGEFKYADYLNYGSTDKHSGLTACYTDDQATVETQYYDDNGDPTGEPVVLRTAYVNTEMGLKAALASTVYNSSIQVFGKDEENYEVMLSKEETDPEVYTAPCTLMTNAPFTVGKGVTLNLAPGTFNQFNNGLTVAGTLNVNSQGNMCFVNGGTQIVNGGTLTNQSGSTLCFNGDVSVAGEKDDEHGELYNSFGFMQFCGGQTQIDGFFLNQGRAENYSEMKVSGHLRIEDDNQKITYDPNETNDEGEELGWEGLNDHVLFNRGVLKVEEGGALNVNGALQNDNHLEVCGTMNVCASAAGNNMDRGVVNGSVKNHGLFEVNGNGELNVEAAYEADGGNGTTAHPYAAVFVNAENFSVGAGANVYLGGVLLQDSYLSVEGRFYTNEGSKLYNYDYLNVLENGTVMQSGYVQNDNLITVDGAYNITPAMEDNTNNGNCVDQDSVLCNNGELRINEGGKLDVRGGDEDAHFSAIVHNNGCIENEGGTLTLGGLLRNFNKVENRGAFTVAEDGRIENHNQLRVGNSVSYEGWGYEPITWAAEGNKPTENNLSDNNQLRLAQVREEGENTWFELRPDVYSIKGDEWRDMVVVDGQDYFGGWEQEIDATVTTENFKYDDAGNRNDEFGVLDKAKHIVISDPDDNGLFTLRFEEWGETRVVLEQTVTPEGGNPFVREHRCDGGVSLNDTGFYFDNNIVREDGELNEWRAQEAAVLGNCYCYGPDDELYIMKRDHGVDGNEQTLQDEAEFRINGEEIQHIERDEGWFLVFKDEQCMLKLKLVESAPGRRDILVHFTEEATENFDFQFRYRDMDCYLRCLRPTVFVESVVGFKGQDVTLAVKADNLPELLGYQLQLKYDTNKLTAVEDSVQLEGNYSADPMAYIDKEKGTVRVIVANNANNQINNGELFRVTFTVADTDAVGACDEIAIEFDETYMQKVAVKDGESEKIRNISYCGGVIQTFIPGDVHRDGEVDILDAVRLLRALAQEFELNAAEREAGRLLKDKDDPDIFCVLEIMKYLAFDEPLEYLKAPAAQD